MPIKGAKTPLIQGLRATAVEVESTKRRRGYAIYTKVCNRCGHTSDHTNDKTTVERDDQCEMCLYNRFTIIAKMNAKQTEGIINRTLKYKCVKCGKLYAKPQQCCNAFHEVQGEEMQFGYYCTGCNHIYTEKIDCCTGAAMYEGYFKPGTYQEFLNKPKFLLPQNEAFYENYLAEHMKIGSQYVYDQSRNKKYGYSIG